MKVITFFNNKGGVGKTTLTVNIAAYLEIMLGKRVLVLDADPQANTTQMVISQDKWADFYGENTTRSTAKKMFFPLRIGEPDIDVELDTVKGTEHNFGFSLIAGDPYLSMIEDDLSSAWEKNKSGSIGGIRTTNWLNRLANSVSSSYDYLIIDVGPSLGAINRSILLNTDFIVTPMGSDIFSLMGITNISNWISDWRKIYSNGIKLASGEENFGIVVEKKLINIDLNVKPKLAGYSIQQYNARKFKEGKRPVQAYETIISQVDDVIKKELASIIDSKFLQRGGLNLGDVPYLNSIIPLAQSSNMPLFNLTSKEGIRGGQASNVADFEKMLNNITIQLLSNIGDRDE